MLSADLGKLARPGEGLPGAQEGEEDIESHVPKMLNNKQSLNSTTFTKYGEQQLNQ